MFRWIVILFAVLVVFILWVQFNPSFFDVDGTKIATLKEPGAIPLDQDKCIRPAGALVESLSSNHTECVTYQSPYTFPSANDPFPRYQEATNFASTSTPVPLFYQQHQFPQYSPNESNAIESGPLHMAPDMWNYRNESMMNGGTFGTIVPHEPVASVEASYRSTRFIPRARYPEPSANNNMVDIPPQDELTDDLRMGLGIPAHQASYINQRYPH